MKKSEIMEAFRREVESKQQLIRDCADGARRSNRDWEIEAEQKCAMNYAHELWGAAGLMRRLGFLDWDQMNTLYEEARKAAEAVGWEVLYDDAC